MSGTIQADPAGETTHELPMLELRGAVRPGSLDAEKRTVEVIWTTGARVLRGFWDRYWEELSLDPKHVRMDRLQSGASPVLDSHNSWDLSSVIGVVESATVGASSRATLRFARAEDDPNAEKIFRKVQDGIIKQVSVGYRVYRLEKVEETADKIPVMRATDWQPLEISFVAVGADAGAGVRSERASYPCVFVTRSTSQTEESTTMESKIQPAAAAAPSVPPPAEPARAAADESALRKAADDERERIAAIRKMVRTAKLDEDFAQRMIDGKTTVDAARAQVLDELAKRDEATPTEQYVRVTEDASDKFTRGASAWIIQKAGMAEAVRGAIKARPDHVAFRGMDLDPGEFRGMRLLDLARMCLERAGVKVRGLTPMELVGKAFTHVRAGGMQTTSDFAILLETALHKTLLAAYAVTPDTWRRFCAVGSVSDFRPHYRYRTGSMGILDVVNEHGEFKRSQIPDGEKQTVQAETRGNIIALTRQAIINDDMGVFNNLAAAQGRRAALTIEVLVYQLLAENAGLGPTMSDGKTLFHADHGNISTGAALSAAAIDADRVAIGGQTDPSGNELLDLRPAFLLIPLSLGSTARGINENQYDPDTVANKAQYKTNSVRGLFRDVIDTARLTGTRRYLFADPSVAPVIEVDFLDGAQEPFLDSMEGWDIDGTEWKVRLDVGVDAVDYRGAVTNAGT